MTHDPAVRAQISALPRVFVGLQPPSGTYPQSKLLHEGVDLHKDISMKPLHVSIQTAMPSLNV